MNVQSKIEAEILPPESENTDIVLVIEINPKIALLDAEKYGAFYQRIKAETEKLVPDVSTAKGRDEIRSMAAKVTKTKAAIDKARLALTAQWRDQTKQVNDAGKKIEAELDALADEVRKPLTDWESAEKARKERCVAVIAKIKADMVVSIDDTAVMVRERGAAIYRMTFDETEFAGFLDDATDAKAQAVDTLKTALVRLTKEEADRAELEQLRAEQAERDAREAAEQEAREAVEAKRKYARDVIEHIHQCGLGMIGGKTYPYVILIRELEEKITATEAEFGDMAADVEKARTETLARVVEVQKADAERSAREAAQQAAEAARREEARKAQKEQRRRDAEHEAQLAAERKRATDAEAAAQAERDSIERERAAEAARVKADEEARAKREADQKHRTVVKTKAKEAIMSCGADEETAKKIVLAIIAGEVPAVRLEF
jgi:colicin import membrane protein